MAVGALGLAALEGSISGLKGAMVSLKDSLKNVIDFADTAQKASLALGTTYEQASSSLKPSIDGLRGSIENRFGAGMLALEAGLQGNTKGISTLINQQQLTGTQYKKTADTFARLEAGLGLSRDQTNELSESLITTGNKFGISTDKLVNALDSMKESLPFQKLAGWGDKFAGSIAELQGMLGPQFGSEVNQMMKMITDVSMDGMRKLSVLGIGDIRERIQNAKDQDEVTKILLEGIKRANKSITSLVGPEGAFGGGGAALEQAVGRGTVAFSTLADNIGERIINPIAVDYANTFATLKSEIWVPLKEFFAQKFYPPFLKFTEYLTKVSRLFVENFTNALEGFDFAQMFKTFSITLVNLGLYFAEHMPPILEGLKTLIERLSDYFKTETDQEKYSRLQQEIIEEKKAAERRIRHSMGGGGYSNLANLERQLEALKQKHNIGADGAFPKEPDNPAVVALREMKKSLESIEISNNKVERNTQQTADNTEPQQTMSSYLMETTSMLDNAIRGVLGVDGVNQMEKVEGLLEQLVGGQGETINMAEEMQTSTYMTSVANISFNGGF
jgi:hypothetical protein